MPNLLASHAKANSIDGIKSVTQYDIDDVLESAANLQRGRAPILVHKSFDEVPQRFVNCLDGKSYIRPHMHVVPNQWELMSWLSGEIIAIIFNNDGVITHKIPMNAHEVKLIEIPPFCYHSFVAINSGAYLEIRNCKYQPSIDRIYSSWSPEEESEEAQQYQKRLLLAKVGDKLTI